MARAQITPVTMLARIQKLEGRIIDWKKFSVSAIKIQNGKAWSGVEIILHMIIAQEAYSKKMDETLKQLPFSENKIESIRASAIPSFLIKRFPPKDGKVKFKMKTTKQFKPLLSPTEIEKTDVSELKTQLKNSLEQLKNWVTLSSTKNVFEQKFASAIGPIVQFNVLEACEFILCHNERHFHQLEKSLAQTIG